MREICETCFFCSFCKTVKLEFCKEEDYVYDWRIEEDKETE